MSSQKAVEYSVDTFGSASWAPIKLFDDQYYARRHHHKWPAVQVSCHDVCQGDMDRPVQIEVIDQDEDGNNLASMGSFEITVGELLKRNKASTFWYNLVGSDGHYTGKIAVVEARLGHAKEKDSTSSALSSAGRKGHTSPVTKTHTTFKAVPGDARSCASSVLSAHPSCTETVVSAFSSTSTKDTQKDKADVPTQNTFMASLSTQESPLIRHNSPPVISYAKKTEKTLSLTLGALNLAPITKGFTDAARNARFTVQLFAFRAGDANPFQLVYSSDPIRGDINPVWKECSIDLDELCSGNLDWPIMITILDRQTNGRDANIGSYQSTVRELLRNQVEENTHKTNSAGPPTKMALRKGFRENGMLKVVKAEVHGGTENTQVNETLTANYRDSSRPWLLRTRNIVVGLASFGSTGDGKTDTSEAKSARIGYDVENSSEKSNKIEKSQVSDEVLEAEDDSKIKDNGNDDTSSCITSDIKEASCGEGDPLSPDEDTTVESPAIMSERFCGFDSQSSNGTADAVSESYDFSDSSITSKDSSIGALVGTVESFLAITSREVGIGGCSDRDLNQLGCDVNRTEKKKTNKSRRSKIKIN